MTLRNRRDRKIFSLLTLGFLFYSTAAIVPASGSTNITRVALFNRPDSVKSVESEIVMRKDVAAAVKSVIDNMNKARDTGDDHYYALAESSLNKVFAIDSSNYNALCLKAWIQSGRHQFSEALDTAKQANKIRPYDSSNYGVMVDALVELGRYDQAVDAAQRMVDLKPSMAAYSRIAYLRWFYGDPEGAIEMMKMAVNAGSSGSSETAWCIVQLGNEYFKQGKIDLAEGQYKRALEMFPNYVHALAAMGKIKVAHGDYKAAIKFYQQAVANNPTHAYTVALGDVFALSGDKKRANEQYDLVKCMARARQSNPETSLKMAIFYTDHDENLAEALKLAKRDAGSSEDIPAWDALAWAYYKNGRYSQADVAMRKALRLGTKDALLFFHEGMIQRALGNNEEAKKYLDNALTTNPYFDPRYALVAKDNLKQIDKEQARANTVYSFLLIIIPVIVALAIVAIIWAIKTRRQRQHELAA